VQRLFSSFADGWPGVGLLLLRLLAGGVLLYGGFLSGGPTMQAAPAIIAAAFGVLLIVGLLTPLAGITAAAIEIWIAFSHPESRAVHIGPACVSLSLAMIGPGAWSIDARLFGRRQIDLSEL
jgi:uncharacterized membrane protein YphA (DoxX/SURF4 family)